MTDLPNRVESLRDRLGRAVDDSLLVRTTRRVEATLAGWVHGSRIVRWFLAEPDPEVVVIDLRKTYTVGPLLDVLDRVVTTGSRLAERTGATGALSKATARIESEPLRVFGILLLAVAIAGLAVAALSEGALGGWLILLGVALLASRERRSAGELGRTRAGRALKAAFEPPEPPERRD
jgi:hypothetical protein